jgi:rubrerythrin
LRVFLVPGDSSASAALHLARTVVRRAERQVTRLVHRGDVANAELVPYLNRLSTLLFVLARWEDWQAGLESPTRAHISNKGEVELTSETDQLVLDILRQAAENEIDTRRFYLEAADRTDDARGEEMYRFLAEEEALHLRIVRMQIDALSAGRGWAPSPEVQPGPLAELETLFRTPREKLREGIRPEDQALDALIIALEMEDSSFKVYRQAAAETGDPVGQKVLGYLARAELTHFDLVMQNYESLLYQQYWRGLPDVEGEGER